MYSGRKYYNKYNIKIVNDAFKKEGYILTSEEYINPHNKLNYICTNGHKHSISWNKWMYGRRCPYCSNKIKYKIETIRKMFESDGYMLLEKEYKNVFTKMRCVCNRGHVRHINLHNWINGARCLKCKHDDMLGEGNPNWKGGISCEPYCDVWLDKEFKKSIKQRDKYKCLNPYCIGISKRLTIHHIDYNKKNCSPQNLITICNSCNSSANKDRCWHEWWYKAIMLNRYGYNYINRGN